ncbi:MAG: ATP-binding cassette domain-containing protein [Nitriliruptorales bacterium]|nr:ATP-binding cassette domain-containing protein [Nitriliruptorales bacterium]
MSADLAIQCAGMTRHFGALPAVCDVDLAVPRGVVFGFLGPNGAGKTTTIRLLLGLLAPTAGSVRVLGEPLPEGGGRVRERTGTVLEQHGLYEGLSVRGSLEFAAASYRLSRRAAAERVERVVGRLGLADRLDDRPQVLSRGMRQRMSVARALLGDPELLILDEPTNGLDAEAAAGLRAEVTDLASTGTTVFYTTHLLAEAERLCDLVTVVKQGRVLASGTPAELRRRARVERVRLEGPRLAGRLAALRHVPFHWTALAPDAVRLTVDSIDDVPRLVAMLVAAGVPLHRVEPEGQTLEAAFLRLVGVQETGQPVEDAAPSRLIVT